LEKIIRYHLCGEIKGLDDWRSIGPLWTALEILFKFQQLFFDDIYFIFIFFQGYEAGGSLPCNFKNMLRIGAPLSFSLDEATIEDINRNFFLEGFEGMRMKVWDGKSSGRQRATPHSKSYFRYHMDNKTIGFDFIFRCFFVLKLILSFKNKNFTGTC
jgi:hypothetical protein